MVNKTYLLIGIGTANLAVLKYFESKQVKFCVFLNDELSTEKQEHDYAQYDYIVKSPGISLSSPLIQHISQTNKQIISDLELFFLFFPTAYYLVVTGTNGKTTTVTLLNQLLKQQYTCLLGGNVGKALFELADEMKLSDQIVIVEASSYMLESTNAFMPSCYVILNITPHHLAHHGDFNQYCQAKFKPLSQSNGIPLISCQDVMQKRLVKYEYLDYLDDCLPFHLVVKDDGMYQYEQCLFSFENTMWKMAHNQCNLKAALMVLKFFPMSVDKIIKALSTMNFPPYRMTKVFDNGNCQIFNDAKATTLEASFKAIKYLVTLNKPIVWIVGGHSMEEQYDFSSLTNLNHQIKAISYNQNACEVERACRKVKIPCQVVASLEKVFEELVKTLNPMVILFSPGFPSFDLYNNFEERGAAFNLMVDKYFR